MKLGALRHEVRLIARPFVALLIIVMAGAVLLASWNNARTAQLQFGYETQAKRFIETADCAQLLAHTPCVAERQQARSDLRETAAANARFALLVAADRHPLGAARIATLFVGSLPGLMLAILLAAALVGGDWERRTFASQARLMGSSWTVFCLRVSGLWAVLLTSFLITWVSVACLAPILARAYPLRGDVGVGTATDLIGPRVFYLPLILLGYAVFGACAGVVGRSVVATLEYAILGCGILLVADKFGGDAISSAIGTLLAVDSAERGPFNMVEWVWPGGAGSADVSLLVLVASTSVIATLAFFDLRRRDL